MSLVFPEHGSKTGRFIGIDPGTGNLGFSVLEFDFKTAAVVSLQATSFRSDRMLTANDVIPQTHSERVQRIYAQKDNLVRQFRYYHPVAVCCESPFYNRLRPSAYGPLVEIVSAIRTAAIEYNRFTPFFLYSPLEVKQTVGAKSTAGKEAVKIGVTTNSELIAAYRDGDIHSLDEHAIDAIAVAHTHLLNYRKGKQCY